MSSPEHQKAIQQRLLSIRHWIFSRRCIRVLKSALAYTLSIMLPFLRGFDDLEVYPATYSSMVIVIIAAFPGKSTGEVCGFIALAMLGVAIGAGNFAILAKLRSSLPAQGVVFVIMVYLLAILKAYHLKYFGLSLLAILMTFNGIYTSIVTGRFIPAYLESYFKSYLWGGALVVGVNILVLPESSERQLRQTLVTSLDHIAIFLHLIAKTYTLTITDEERKVRDGLNQSIRADFGLLNAKAEAATIEINWSRWSTEDYNAIITQTRKMQLGLIAMYSSLVRTDETDSIWSCQGDSPLFRERFLPSTIGPFHRLRRSTQKTIMEIQNELSGGCSRALGTNHSGYEVYFDLEKQENSGELGDRNQPESDGVKGSDSDNEKRLSGIEQTSPKRPRPTHFVSSVSVSDHIRAVSNRLSQEVERAQPSTVRESAGSSSGATMYGGEDDRDGRTEDPNVLPKVVGCAKMLKAQFSEFEKKQLDLLTQAICSGSLYGDDPNLHVRALRPSVWDAWGPDHIRGHTGGGITHEKSDDKVLRKRRTDTKSGELEDDAPIQDPNFGDDSDEPEDQVVKVSNASLMHIFGMILSLDSFTSNLGLCHAIVTRKDSTGRSRRSRLRFHLFERLRKPHRHQDHLPESVHEHTSHSSSPQMHGDNDPNAAIADPSLSRHLPLDDDPQSTNTDLSMKEALALLEGREYVPDNPGFWLRVSRFEALFRTPTSIYAAKVAAACAVFATLIWANGTRQFFLTYGIQGSLLSIVVALSPTLGQSVRTFVLQIVGSSIGYLLGLAFLEMFKNVGGYHFNPYGVTCMVGLFSLPACWLLYERPQYFTGALLGLNACGSLVINEWVQVVHSHSKTYGEPPIRVGRFLAGLAIALAIVLVFQLLILRNPARRTLRKHMAHVMYSEMAYTTILQAFVRGVMPTETSFRPPQAAVERVIEELQHREHRIQAQILSAMPLIAFSKDEPQWSKPFQAGEVMKIVRANQIILDRLRDARFAIGHKGFSDHLLKSIVHEISPYRTRLSRLVKDHFCLTSASIRSKSPLPHDTLMGNWISHLMHDALVVSQKFAQTPEGQASIAGGEFTRYWFYLLSICSIGEQIQIIEDSLRRLFGEIEDDHRLW